MIQKKLYGKMFKNINLYANILVPTVNKQEIRN